MIVHINSVYIIKIQKNSLTKENYWLSYQLGLAM